MNFRKAIGTALAVALLLSNASAAFAQYGGGDEQSEDDIRISGDAGDGSFTFESDGWLPDSDVEAFIDDDEVEVTLGIRIQPIVNGLTGTGTLVLAVTADDSGVVRGTVEIPDDLSEGTHTFSLRGTGADGQPRTVSTTFEVGPDGGLAFSGSNSSSTAMWALAALLIGVVMVWGASRNRRRSSVSV